MNIEYFVSFKCYKLYTCYEGYKYINFTCFYLKANWNFVAIYSKVEQLLAIRAKSCLLICFGINDICSVLRF